MYYREEEEEERIDRAEEQLAAMSSAPVVKSLTTAMGKYETLKKKACP